jgi:hypothetical protein
LKSDEIPQLSLEENAILTSDSTKEEVYKAISEMEHNKVLRPDGLPAELYHIGGP